MISVLIPTKNEELTLADCLQSVSWCDDVHVYDSGSTDATTEIACAANATLWRAPFNHDSVIFGGNEAEHRNWALRNITFKHKWVLHVDADERVTPGLLDSIIEAARSPGDKVAFLVQRRDFFQGQWLKHVQATPYYLRLFRPDKMSYQRLINPVSVPDGPVATISGYLDHFPFSKGIAHWFGRHNSYSTLEAEQTTANLLQNGQATISQALFSPQITERRFHQKQLFSRMPARPILKFFLLYIAKGGFLDGRAGFTYAALQSIYEYMIVLKSRELMMKSSGGKTIERPLAKTASANHSHHGTGVQVEEFEGPIQ
jgi:glycosyltransferase involved in cell wall biosynthesis